jgi:hypothetical protein
MARYFTVDEANGMLGEVERHLREALYARKQAEEAERELEAERTRILMSGGAAVDRGKVTKLVAGREAFGVILRQELLELAEMGVQVKDLELGLIDFPTIYHGEEVLLCWKLGEAGIEYWHGVREGFRGRKRIDEAFLTGHRANLG